MTTSTTLRETATLDFIDSLTAHESYATNSVVFYHLFCVSTLIKVREYFISESAIPEEGGMVDAARGSERILPGLIGLIQEMRKQDERPSAKQIYARILQDIAKIIP